MSKPSFSVSLLAKQDRSGFRCGVDALDRYFHTQVGQDMRRSMAVCYVVEEIESGMIAGFYTLSAADIPITDAPAEMVKRLPRYPTLPVVRMGRLAVDERFRGMKLGAVMLANAARRAEQNDIAIFAMIVDAKDDEAAAFYRHHGFASYGASPHKLIAPLKDLLPQ